MRDVFCTGAIYNNVFFETKEFIVACDKRPVMPGHSLVIPKRHVESIEELNDGEILAFRDTLKLLIPRLLKAYNADAYNLAVNTGEHAGMGVMHLHFHVVPRGKDDQFQKKTFAFYRELQSERIKYEKEVAGEVDRLRKIFKYESKQTGV